MSEQSITSVESIQLPTMIVELVHLKTRDGSPVRVQCESIDELKLVDIVKSWPGLSVPLPAESVPNVPPEEQVRMVSIMAPSVIEAGTVLHRLGGGEVRPAFYFGDTAPNPQSIPGRMLRASDIVLLVEGVLRCSGYMKGGPADSGSFHGRDGGGGGAGGAAGGDGQGLGPDPVGSGE